MLLAVTVMVMVAEEITQKVTVATHTPVCLPAYLPVCLVAFLTCLFTSLSVCFPSWLPFCLPACLPAYIPTYLPFYLSHPSFHQPPIWTGPPHHVIVLNIPLLKQHPSYRIVSSSAKTFFNIDFDVSRSTFASIYMETFSECSVDAIKTSTTTNCNWPLSAHTMGLLQVPIWWLIFT